MPTAKITEPKSESETLLASLPKPVLRTVLRQFTQTGEAEPIASVDSDTPAVPISVLYPHWAETDARQGKALRHLAEAGSNLEVSLAQFDAADLAATMDHINASSKLLHSAYEFADFHDPFGAVISFCFRALDSLQLDELTASALHAMISSLTEIQRKPYVSYPRVVKLIARLRQEGWRDHFELPEKLMEAVMALSGFEVNTGNQSSEQRQLSFDGEKLP